MSSSIGLAPVLSWRTEGRGAGLVGLVIPAQLPLKRRFFKNLRTDTGSTTK